MGQFDLEKYFRNRIKGQTENVDTDAIWKALDLEKKDKERGFLFWLKGSIPLALLGLSIWWVTLTDKSIEASEAPEVMKVEEIISKGSVVSDIALSQPTQVASDNTNTDVFTKSNISKNKSTTKTQLNSSANDPKNKKASRPTINAQSTSASLIIERNFSNSLPSNSNDNKIIALDNNSLIVVRKDVLPYLSAINHFKLSPFDILQRKDELENYTLPKIIEVTKIKNKLSLGLFSEYLFANRSLNGTSSDITNLIDSRNASEDILEAYALGADLKYAFPSGVYLKLGIEYHNINERFTYNSETQDTTIFDDIPQTRFVSASGDTTVATGPGLAYQSVNTEWIYYNQHRLISIPLTIGYELKKGRWTFFGEGTYSTSLFNFFRGHQLDEQLQVTESPNYFYSSPIMSVAGSIGIGYQLSSRLRINIQPRFQTYLNSFTKRESGMSQKYNLIGIRLGGAFTF